MNLIYGAAGCLVVAQIVGLYALLTRKADLVFTLLMILLLGTALVLGSLGVYHQLR